MAVLDHERCHVSDCTLHYGWKKITRVADLNAQIREDWKSGEWPLEDLSAFYGLSLKKVTGILLKTT